MRTEANTSLPPGVEVNAEGELQVNLYEQRSNSRDGTSILVRAAVRPGGNLEIRGHDVGGLVKDHWGGVDYEYSLIIPNDQKDLLILSLLRDLLTGDPQAVSRVEDYCRQNSIVFDRESWVGH